MNGRRAALAAAAAGIAALAAWRLGVPGIIGGRPQLAWRPLKEPPGFRALATTGPLTGANPAIVGLNEARPAGLVAADRAVRADPCAALFEDAGATGAGLVPVAYFFDYQCPICRRLTPILRRTEGIALTFHELSGLGSASAEAARASVAARRLGRFDEFHDRLMRARLVPDRAYALALGESIGLDPAALVAAMDAPETQARLWASQALADLFGIFGTPGLVVGSTLVIGGVPEEVLTRLIEVEAATAGPCG